MQFESVEDTIDPLLFLLLPRIADKSNLDGSEKLLDTHTYLKEDYQNAPLHIQIQSMEPEIEVPSPPPPPPKLRANQT